MKLLSFLPWSGLCGILTVVLGLPLFGQSTNSAVPATNAPGIDRSLSAYHIIAERNIFNPNRTSRTSPQQSRPEERKPEIETLTLVGTFASGEKVLAFFDGTRSSFKKVAREGDAVSDFKVQEITPKKVTIASGTNTFGLVVGQHIAREDEGPWELKPVGTELPESTSSISSTSTTATESESPKSSGGEEEDDIVKKLMKRREQEGKK